ncbi:MAG: sulfite exporter TauE/SafE family protein [Candidatus Marinimicrobia bacterium]|nr:sulfite exporter TauE/SafE family protein [Candidatus Neomarinimicrobiota bacterium]
MLRANLVSSLKNSLSVLSTKKLFWFLTIIILFLVFTCLFEIQFSWGIAGILILCFVCELMDSSLGMGYGTTLTPVLLAFGYEPLALVPTILLSEFLSGFASSYFHHESGNVDFSRQSKDLRNAMLLALGSVVGVAIGVNIAIQIPTHILKLLIGIIITLAGVSIWLFHKHSFEFKTWKMFVLASIASFNKALSGGGYGPLLTSGQILSGIKGKSSVGITSFAEGFTCLIGVILFLGKGQGFTPELLVPVVTGALLSVPVSTEFVKRTQESTLKVIIAVLTTILGVFTILKVIL